MSVEEQVHDRRSQEARRPAALRRTPPGLGPVVAAAVVLLLWLLWLALPTGYGDAGSAGGSTPRDGDGRDLLSVAALGGPTAGTRGGALLDGQPRRAEPDAAADDAQPRDPAGDDPTSEVPSDGTRAGDVTTGDPGRGGPVGGDAAAQASAEPAPPVEVPQRGDGRFVVAPGTSAPVGSGDLVRYSVEVEAGVPLDPARVAAVVDAVLGDPRSWTADGSWSLQRTDSDPDVRVRVTSPDTTDALCAPLRTGGQLSCRNGADVVLNALRWTQGAGTWGDDLDGYRQYLVNHEVGHFLGHGHVPCPGAGQPAPVMLQQTKGLDGCTPNAWPFP